MSYTSDRQPQGNVKRVESLLREGMIAEIIAINDYTVMINSISNEQVKELFTSIMQEEKKHYGMFLELLRLLDVEERDLSENAKNKIKICAKKRPYASQISNGDILSFIRDAIKGELEAIILYQDIASRFNNEKIVSVINKIIYGEKDHVEKLTRALTILDVDTYDNL